MDQLSHSRREWLPAYDITLQVITTLLIGIRLLSRFHHTGGILGIDDLFISIAWAITTAGNALILLFDYKYGLDRHMWDVPVALWQDGTFLGWLLAGLFLWSTCFTKLSVLLFYRRLVAGTCSKAYKIAIWVAMAIVFIYTFIMFWLLIVTCSPIDSFWLRLDPTYTTPFHCTSNQAQTRVSQLTGALSVITDFYSVLLPAVLVFKMNITRRQRIGLMLIFGVGFLVVVAGIVRTVYLSKVESDDIDKTWNSFNVFVAGMAEENVAIICACAPSLKSCFRNFFKDHFTTKGSSYGMTSRSKNTETTQTWKGSQKSQTNESDEKGFVLVEHSISIERNERVHRLEIDEFPPVRRLEIDDYPPVRRLEIDDYPPVHRIRPL